MIIIMDGMIINYIKYFFFFHIYLKESIFGRLLLSFSFILYFFVLLVYIIVIHWMQNQQKKNNHTFANKKNKRDNKEMIYIEIQRQKTI